MNGSMSANLDVVVGHVLDVPPEPLRLARRLAVQGLAGLAVLHDAESSSPSRHSYLAVEPDAESRDLDPMAAVDGVPVTRFGRWPRWIGVIPYEACRPMERAAWSPKDDRASPLLKEPRWLRYPAVARVSHATGQVMVVGEEGAAGRLAVALCGDDAPGAPPVLDVTPAHPAQDHLARVSQGIELIRSGDLYQVNLARRLDVNVKAGRPLDVFARLCEVAGGAYAAYIELDASLNVLSNSPELLLDAQTAAGGHRFVDLVTEPIKGTRPRGTDQQSDRALQRELAADRKERAELAMIVDVERHDLGRVAVTGSVRVTRPPHVVRYRTVHHRKARLTALVRPDASRADVIASMVPSGSVTGAPKIRAMEVIRGLEAERRGLYTGGIGYVSHDGSMRLGMAIRTMVLSGTHGHYWTGGGIVIRSRPEDELEETRWKAAQFARLVSDFGTPVAREIPT